MQRLIKIRDPSMDVELASNGPEALDRLKRESFDLILLDILMPTMSGWEVIQNLRLQDKNWRTPVLILSAQDLADQPPTSQFYIASNTQGYSIKRLLECSTVLSNLFIANPLLPV